MKTRIFIGLAALALFAAACEKEVWNAEAPKDGLKTYTAVMEQTDDTRSSVTAEGKFSWENGDEISVLGGAEIENTVSLSVDVNGVGSFSTSVSSPEYATYPRIAKSYSGGVLTVELPAAYDYTGSTNAAMLAVMTGVTDDPTTENVTFRHLGSVLRITLNSVPTGTTKMVFTTDRDITGDFVVTNPESSAPSISAAEKSTKNTITFNFTATVGVEDMTFYVPLPAGEYKQFDIELFNRETSVFKKTTAEGYVGVSVVRRQLLILPTIFVSTANCYLVSEAGTYTFNALVRGNGYAPSSTVVANIAADETYTADVLWETFGTSTAPQVGDLVKNVSYSNGSITFTATGEKGNALITLKNGTEILWSWHIWLADKPVNQVYNNNAGTMMDRNLGATSAEPGSVGSLGLMYQWGRKDPFMGSASVSDGTEKAASTLKWPAVQGISSKDGFLADLVKIPTTFIYESTEMYDWLYVKGGLNNADNLTRWQTVKTMYDPCPAGYRVPDGRLNNESRGLWGNAFDLQDYSFNQTGLWNSEKYGFDFAGVSANNKYFLMSRSADDSETVCWYPFTGELSATDKGNLKDVGTYGYYWSCTASTGNYEDRPQAGILYFYHYYTNNIDDISLTNNMGRTNGRAVRCLKE